MQNLVLDTNIVLDLWVFDDPAVRALRAQLVAERWRWLATPAMRDELEHVLAYPQLASQMQTRAIEGARVLDLFDAHAVRAHVPEKAALICRDPDDQKFIDLAVAHRSWLISKDKAVLALTRRLLAVGVTAARTVNDLRS
jgi:putative PIN family toxin of toxin-antitoxin system